MYITIYLTEREFIQCMNRESKEEEQNNKQEEEDYQTRIGRSCRS